MALWVPIFVDAPALWVGAQGFRLGHHVSL